MQNAEMSVKLEVGVCRLCGGSDAAIDIFSNHDSQTLSSQAMSFAKISITRGDGLPEVVCTNCSLQIATSFHFKIQCEKTDKYFRTLLSVNNEGISNKNNGASDIKQENIQINSDSNLSPSAYVSNYGDSDDRLSADSVIIEEQTDTANDMKKKSYKIRVCKNSKLQKLNKKNARSLTTDSTDTCIANKNNEIASNNCENSIYKCEVCEKTFSDKSHLSKHLPCTKNARKKHAKSNDELLMWLRDSKNSFDEQSERLHIEKTDKNTRVFMCDICGGTFKNMQIMIQHQKTHTGIKLYSCNLCKKKFTRSSHVVSHMRIHNNIKPYICEICGRSFIKSSDLARHRRIHFDTRDYPCPLCSRRFKRSSDVTSHLRSHTGDRPFSCPCGKSYTSHSSLRKHKKVNCLKKPSSEENIKTVIEIQPLVEIKPKTELQT